MLDLIATSGDDTPNHDGVYLRRGDAIEIQGKLLVVESRCLKPQGYVFSEPGVFQVEHPIASKDIVAWHQAGKLIFVSKDEFGLPIGVRENLRRSIRAFTPAEKKEIVRRLRYCRALDDLGPGFARSKATLRPVCMEVASRRGDTEPHDWSSVYRWWRIWARAGRDPRALCPRTAKRGRRGSRFEAYQLKAMRDAIEGEYLRRHRPNMTTAHKACVLNIVNYLGGEEKAEEVVARMALSQDATKRSPFPSIKAFRAECKRYSRVVRMAGRLGPAATRQEMYPVGAGPKANLPFHRVEADFKYLRLFVVDEDSGMPLGTPYLMAAIDCFSGCIAGFDIGFDPPSYVSAARTLKHIIGYKDTGAFGKGDDGRPVIRNAYPLNGVPVMFFVDHDQVFHSKSFVRSAKVLGCHVDYIPPSQSWKKGRIERFWGTVQECFLDMFPGKVLRFGDEVGRDYKPENDAVITLKQLRLFVTKAIVDVYHQGDDPGSGEKRIDRWNRMAPLHPPRPVRMHDDLIELVGAYETRKAERRGLRLFGLRYNSGELARYRAGFERDPMVEVRYDPQEIGWVTLIDHKKGFTLRVPCTRPDYADGLSLHQHLVIQRRAKSGSVEERIRMAKLLMAKAELFKIGQSMLKVRKTRGRLTKVAQFLGIGREVIDLMSRGRLDPQESASPIDLAAEDIDDAEDDRLASADESLVETYRDEPDRSTKPKPGAKPKGEPRSPRPKAERTSPAGRVAASPTAKAPPAKATPAATTPRRTRPLPPLPPRNAKIEYDD